MGFFGKKKPGEIDLTDTVDLRTRSFQFGYPTRCTACGDRGFLDHIDPFKKVQYEHCVSCGEKWQLHETEVEALTV